MQEFRKTLRKVAAIGTSVAMLGMTVTGALAADYTLADYPKPFQNGGNTLIVLGAVASTDDNLASNNILSGLPAAASSSSSTSTATTNAGTVVLDQKYSKDIVMGTALSSTGAFGSEVRDTFLPGLKAQTTLISTTTNPTTYETHEKITFGSDAVVSSGLALGAYNASGIERYGKNVLLRLPNNAVTYTYVFDSALSAANNISAATVTNPITLDFLGKTLVIEGTTGSDTKIVAVAGDKFSMEAGDSVSLLGKKVTVNSIGSSAVSISVDGVTEVLSGLSSGTSTKTINGLSIRAQDLLDVGASTTAGKSSVTLVISDALTTGAVKTYTSGDQYIGQNKYTPLWKWSLSGLTTSGSPTLAVTLGYPLDSNSVNVPDYPLSHAPYVGDLLCLPNNYACLTIEKVSESDDGFGEYQIRPTSTLLYAADGTSQTGTTSFQTLMIKSLSTNTGIGLKTNGTTGADTSEIYVRLTPNAENTVSLFKRPTSSGNPAWYANVSYGTMGAGIAEIGSISYKSTTLPLYLAMFNESFTSTGAVAPFTSAVTGQSYIRQGVVDNTTLAGATAYKQFKLLVNHTTADDDQLQVFFRESSTGAGINYLGHRPVGGTYASNDLLYNPANGGSVLDISAYTGDTRTASGMIVKSPQTGITSDDLRLLVPRDGANYKATVVLATTKGGSKPTVVKGVVSSSSIAMKDTEVTDVTQYNAIVVGGPAVNKVAAQLLGKEFPAYGANSGLVEGQAVIELKKNGSNWALLVAGWEAADTQRAGLVLKNFAQFKDQLKGTSVTVKGTGMEVSGITVA